MSQAYDNIKGMKNHWNRQPPNGGYFKRVLRKLLPEKPSEERKPRTTEELVCQRTKVLRPIRHVTRIAFHTRDGDRTAHTEERAAPVLRSRGKAEKNEKQFGSTTPKWGYCGRLYQEPSDETH